MIFKFAIPVEGDHVSDHFGHSREFCFIDAVDGRIVGMKKTTSPKHDPGVIPGWLAGLQVSHVLAIGIGQKAIDLLTENQIEVVWGVPSDKPELLVKAYLDSQLGPGINLCDH